ncbi:MAG: lytic transglycosylase domain-containing protein [Myxococcales bacterium]|nr:lytic transglycosylase domain-containing protein [Myxococcales bacterium]
MADVFYYCTNANGTTWMTNQKKPGTKCRVAMVTGGGATSQPTTPYQTAARAAPNNPTVSKPLERPLTPTKLLPEGRRPDSDVQQAVEAASQKFQIPEELIHAVIQVESGYDPNAVSRAGAMGLMQLMPATATEYGVVDVYDTRQNIMGGTKYIRWLANYFNGDIIKTLSAYHAGLVAVNEKNGIPYSNTEAYVKKVLSHYYRLKEEAAERTQPATKP